ncbi:MAG: nucleotide exchange factor GrpE [bacterium]|nr:nucleotide exchange factor GrpE [bacterium]
MEDEDQKPATTAALRERLLERFASWLDEALARREPPAGIAAEILAELEAAAGDDASPAALAPDGCDLYSLWSAMTALTQEVKLQGRSFKQLADRLAPFSGLDATLEEALESHRTALAETRRIADKALVGQRARDEEVARRVRGEMLELVVDLRDRLLRGLEAAQAQLQALRRQPAPRWPQRFFTRRRAAFERLRDATLALEEGYALSALRVDEELERLGVREIECRGRAFDPHRMTAVEVEEVSRSGDGMVLQVYRTGYEWQGEVLRPAEVKVGRASNGEPANDRSQEVDA